MFHNAIMSLSDTLTLPVANIFTYFGQSNLAGKVIVILLIAFSFAAWTIMFGKHFELKSLRSLNLEFERHIKKTASLLHLDPKLRQFARGSYSNLLRDALHAYFRAYSGSISHESRIGHVENALQRVVAEETIKYESKMVLLGSIVSGAPFLGLLGTVWGVMDAFGSIALKSSASIQSLAPGVSGALLTTVAGLLVAIPSVFGYNYLLTQTKMMITELENFASALADQIELDARDEETSEH